jgi:hypothetical protein
LIEALTADDRTKHNTAVRTKKWGPIDFVLYYGTSGNQVSTEFMHSLITTFNLTNRQIDKPGVLEPAVLSADDEKGRDNPASEIQWTTAGFGAIHYGGTRAPAMPPWAVQPPSFTFESIATRLRFAFQGVEMSDDALFEWVQHVWRTGKNTRAVLSHPNLLFIIDATMDIFRAVAVDQKQQQRHPPPEIDVLEVNPKLPILQWICDSKDRDTTLSYHMLGVSSMESITTTESTAAAPKPDLSLANLTARLKKSFDQSKPTLCVFSVDWGRQNVELSGNETHSIMNFPFLEEVLLPDFAKMARQLAEDAAKSSGNGLCTLVMPLPAMRRDVQVLGPADAISGSRRESYRNGKPLYSWKMRDFAFRLFGFSEENKRSGSLQSFPDNASVLFVTTFSKTFLFVTISTRSLQSTKVPQRLLPMLDRLHEHDITKGNRPRVDTFMNAPKPTRTDETKQQSGDSKIEPLDWSRAVQFSQIVENGQNYVAVTIDAQRPITHGDVIRTTNELEDAYRQFLSGQSSTFAEALRARQRRIQYIAQYRATPPPGM